LLGCLLLTYISDNSVEGNYVNIEYIFGKNKPLQNNQNLFKIIEELVNKGFIEIKGGFIHSPIITDFTGSKKLETQYYPIKGRLLFEGSNFLNIESKFNWSRGIFIIGIIGLIFTAYQLLKDTKILNPNTASEQPIFHEESDSFNILILPFFPNKECVIENTNYEHQILERLQNIQIAKSLELNVKFTDNYHCPTHVDAIRKIANIENADFMIWGNYDEECESLSKIRLKYLLVDSIEHIFQKSGQSDFKELEELSKLRQGFLQEDIDYIINLSLAFYQNEKNQYFKALNILNDIKTENCDSLIVLGKGHAYLKLNEYDSADSIYSTLNLCYPDNSKFIYLQGIANSIQYKFRKALVFYQKSIEIDTNFYPAYRNAFMCHVELKNYKEAEKLILIFQDRDWLDNNIISMMGDIKYYQKSYSDAILLYEMIEELDTLNWIMLNRLADSHLKLGNMEKAINYTNQLYSKHPNLEVSYWKKSGILIMNQQFDSAYIVVKEGLKNFPNDTLLLNLAELYN